MKRIAVGWLAGIYVSSVMSCASTPAFKNVASLTDNIDAFLTEVVPESGGGASVIVVQNGAVISNLSRGLAKAYPAEPITANTKFFIASVAKHFTAAAILRLWEQGALDLEDPLIKYFPEAPGFWERATVHHTLSMTSGVPSHTLLLRAAYPQRREEDLLRGITNEEILRLSKSAVGLEFEPGTGYRYSNTGYTLLALIVEQVSGKPFGTYLADEFFGPLGMTSTRVVDESSDDVSDVAIGYEPSGSMIDWNRFATGSRGIVSTVTDLARWMSALQDGTILGPRARALLFARHREIDRRLDYGYGFFVRQVNGAEVFYHTGRYGAFISYLAIAPSKNASIAVLSNCSCRSLDQLGDAVLRYVTKG